MLADSMLSLVGPRKVRVSPEGVAAELKAQSFVLMEYET